MFGRADIQYKSYDGPSVSYIKLSQVGTSFQFFQREPQTFYSDFPKMFGIFLAVSLNMDA